MVITRVAPVSFAKITAILYALLGLILGAIMSLVSLAGGFASSSSRGTGLGLMVGAGAIGNGIALLLSQLAARGRLHIIDKQEYGRENRGTCVVFDDEEWLESSKAERLASWLDGAGLVCTGEQAYVADALSGRFAQAMSVELVLNGLDDTDARRDAQLLWPSVIVDGGINAIGAAVTTHRLDRPHGACMRCSFKPTRVNERGL